MLILGWTTYAFAAMLTSVLVGLAVGSALFAPVIDRVRNKGGFLFVLVLLAGGFAAFGPAIVNALPFVFSRLQSWSSGTFPLLNLSQFVICVLLVFVPTLLSGGAFPLLVRMHSRGKRAWAVRWLTFTP